MSPLVSILLPVYNGERHLEAAVNSALAQTENDFELIIVDDQSTDGSYRIAEELAGKDSRIKLSKNEKNLGLFANYNRCIAQAQGEFLKPFAQDDILSPNALEKMLHVLRSDSSIALVSGACNILDEQGKVSRTRSTFKDSRKIRGVDVILYNLLAVTNWVGEPSTVMYRRAFAGTGFDTNLFHSGDLEMWFRVLQNGDYYFLDECVAGFRRHAGSATNNNLRGLLFALDSVLLFKNYGRFIREAGIPDELYMRSVAEYAALQLDALVRESGLTVSDTLKAARKGARIGISDDDEAVALRLMDAFAQLSFYTLRCLTHTLAELSDVRCRLESDKEYLSRKLQHMEQSTSWRLTAPIRKLLSSSNS